MRARPYSAVADDQCFSRAPFVSGPWAQWAENEQSWLDTRGRAVATDRYMRPVEFTTSEGELARFVFDAAPEEDTYLVRILVQTDIPFPEEFPPVTFYWRIATEDASGGSPRYTELAAQTITTSTIFNMGRRAQACRMNWPASNYSTKPELSSGWATHRVATGLSKTARVLLVKGYVTGLLDGYFSGLYLRAVSAYGARSGA